MSEEKRQTPLVNKMVEIPKYATFSIFAIAAPIPVEKEISLNLYWS